MSGPRARSLLPVVGDAPAANADSGAHAHGGAASPGPAANPAVAQTVWARVLLDSLRRAGVTRAVISPGSRSTPFTLAAAHVGLITETVIDERSAGFFALGYARATNEPTLLICTSGSAGTHYFPAIVEAAHAHIPLIVLTADRPPELHGCAAPQTMDQTHLFGHHVRAFLDLGLPDASRASLRALCRRATQIAHTARAPRPGPVHINACARKPLEPAAPTGAADIAVVERAEDILSSFSPRAIQGRPQAPVELLRSLAQACTAATRGLIVAGPNAAVGEHSAHVQSAFALARATGYPLLSEAASQLRFSRPDSERDDDLVGPRPMTRIDAFDLLLADQRFAASAAPELIIQIGPPPISSAWARYLQKNLNCVHCVVADHGWNDPQASADLLVMADVGDTLQRLADMLGSQLAQQPRRTAWSNRWRTANDHAWRTVTEVMNDSARADAESAMREGQVMAAAAQSVPGNAWLLLGNSLPVRTIDTYAPTSATSAHVLSQRGVNGIDGFLSSAAGTAWLHGASYAATPGRPVVAIIGDVSFAHDLGGLRAAAHVRSPLCVVVIDNDGGRIFEHLPIAHSEYGAGDSVFQKHFVTRPQVDMRAAAAMFGVGYTRVTNAAALSAAITEACEHSGCTIVHAMAQPDSSVADRRAIAARLADLLHRSDDAPA